ncbi:hypothetical protein MOO46_04235 [Apilactobacillus apisilvae]|uniref:DUF7671 domain-containing protein n=1 Tax=Apilactobacillus apisilvae TaxID=2923364 RepID=A0ABY4PF79_9LACO|nr:hypothetical protein [Apilactobacillus apisilvae]UQS84468.1 hypothetical protein MOO46_04235 [Apilactobacillus apisilvae]
MKGKYKVTRYKGVPVENDSSGNYVIRKDDKNTYKLHDWRTGKHTRGKYKELGQIFLTENNMMVAVVATYPVKFKDRHDFTPLQRFTSDFVDADILVDAKKRLDE